MPAKLYSVQLASAYGAADVTSDFAVARKPVELADANFHNIVVQLDSATAATHCASYGSGDIINDPTRVAS